MAKRAYPETGTILATCLVDSGDHEISAAISLPQSVWKRVLDDFDDLHLPPFEPRPERPLRERITAFLENQAETWTSVSGRWNFSTGYDLDDDVPF